jgi:hypothetical protein
MNLIINASTLQINFPSHLVKVRHLLKIAYIKGLIIAVKLFCRLQQDFIISTKFVSVYLT